MIPAPSSCAGITTTMGNGGKDNVGGVDSEKRMMAAIVCTKMYSKGRPTMMATMVKMLIKWIPSRGVSTGGVARLSKDRRVSNGYERRWQRRSYNHEKSSWKANFHCQTALGHTESIKSLAFLSVKAAKRVAKNLVKSVAKCAVKNANGPWWPIDFEQCFEINYSAE